MKKECTCEKCQGACKHSPGWFLPGEAEVVAEYLELSLKELFDKYLAVNWWMEDENIFLLAPAIKSIEPGDMYLGDPRGECVFYENGRCGIHDVKPYECFEYMHDDNQSRLNRRHKKIGHAWKDDKHRKQIEELLGCEPHAEEFNADGGFLGMFGLGG